MRAVDGSLFTVVRVYGFTVSIYCTYTQHPPSTQDAHTDTIRDQTPETTLLLIGYIFPSHCCTGCCRPPKARFQPVTYSTSTQNVQTMPNLLGALMQLTRDDMTFGNDFRQLACGPLFAARHVNAANDSVVPSLKSLVNGSQVPARTALSRAAQGCS